MSVHTASPAALSPASPGTAQPTRLSRQRIWPLVLAVIAVHSAALAAVIAAATP